MGQHPPFERIIYRKSNYRSIRTDGSLSISNHLIMLVVGGCSARNCRTLYGFNSCHYVVKLVTFSLVCTMYRLRKHATAYILYEENRAFKTVSIKRKYHSTVPGFITYLHI